MQRMTGVIIVSVVITLATVDLWLLVTGGVEATFSHVILSASSRWPIIPFAAGVLCGHLFWPQPLMTAPPHYETEIAEKIAPRYLAEVETRLWDGTRVDLLGREYVWEADWAKNWAGGIGKCQYSAIVTRRKPGLILLTRSKQADARYIYRAQTVCAVHGIVLRIETVSRTPGK